MGIALCLICGCGLPVVDLLCVVFGLWIIVGVVHACRFGVVLFGGLVDVQVALTVWVWIWLVFG